MKTKTIFEPSDFEGGGQMIIRNSSPVGSKNISFAASVAYKIGWLAFERSKKGRLVMISLTDGMISKPRSEKEMCEYLNYDECGFRPLTKEETADIILEVGNRF
jgi:hypothetical protein